MIRHANLCHGRTNVIDGGADLTNMLLGDTEVGKVVFFGNNVELRPANGYFAHDKVERFGKVNEQNSN